MLNATNQVIERNIDHLPAGNVLLVDLPDDNALSQLSKQRDDITWFGFTPYINNSNLNGPFKVWHAAWLDKELTDTQFDAVIIYYPKTKLRFDYYLSMVSNLLSEQAIIYVVGEKKGGVKSCEKQIKAHAIKANKLDAARHCQMYWAVFNGTPSKHTIDDWYETFEIATNVSSQNISLTLATLPGVFSAKQLDEGTQLLLDTVKPLSGKGLDFGCGCGVISAAVSKAFGTEMIALDVDALAISASNKTFELNSVNAKAKSSDVLSHAKEQKFDFIITNPPFHTGLKTDYDITETLIKESKSILKNKFQYWMVANAFLPYQQHFANYLKPVEIKNSNKRFNIYYTAANI
jgi:16S rRNA (guanine1207-N2)-methyltransferase